MSFESTLRVGGVGSANRVTMIATTKSSSHVQLEETLKVKRQ